MGAKTYRTVSIDVTAREYAALISALVEIEVNHDAADKMSTPQSRQDLAALGRLAQKYVAAQPGA